MEALTLADRKKELSVLLWKMRTHPSQNWDGARDRAFVLTQLIAAKERGAHA